MRSKNRRLKKFEELEDMRLEEAKRNGLQIEESKNLNSSEEYNGINAPLLANSPVNQQQVQQPGGQNNQNIGQNRPIIPGILIRQPNGAFRLC
mmetsp:Transcript_9694/g.9506  ORF Transcript_9694/g.9506 Transcript_9694/m.9506 type:complete len:93 (-) Transcript_9694:160-438(-)